MTRKKPTREQLLEWKEKGVSFRQIKEITGYSISSISKFYKEEDIEPDPVGRKRGYKASEETRKRMSEAQRRNNG